MSDTDFLLTLVTALIAFRILDHFTPQILGWLKRRNTPQQPMLTMRFALALYALLMVTVELLGGRVGHGAIIVAVMLAVEAIREKR